jgi:hypothetical protein
MGSCIQEIKIKYSRHCEMFVSLSGVEGHSRKAQNALASLRGTKQSNPNDRQKNTKRKILVEAFASSHHRASIYLRYKTKIVLNHIGLRMSAGNGLHESADVCGRTVNTNQKT